MKKRLLLGLVCLLLSAAGALAATLWTVNPRAFRYDMAAYAVLKVNGSAVGDYGDYEIGVFCGDECRGVAKVQTASDGTKYLYLRVYSNQPQDEKMVFRVYRPSAGKEVMLAESLNFKADDVAGTPGSPMVLTLTQAQKGDANGDGKVDIVDVTSTISRILGQAPENFDASLADVNGDGVVNIVDVTSMIEMILKAK